MNPHPLEGLVVPTPWGPRTVVIGTVSGDWDQVITYSFAEDRAVQYRLSVPSACLVSHPNAIRRLVAEWTRVGLPNGSIQTISADRILAADTNSIQ